MFFVIRNPVLRTLAGIIILCVVIFGIPYAAGLLGNQINPPFYPEGMFVIWLKGWLWLIAAAAVTVILAGLALAGYMVGIVLFDR